MPDRDDITDVLLACQRGDARGLEQIVPLVYQELRRIAGGLLRREQPNHSLQATALVHEVYLRLVTVERITLEGRAHFLALAARLMRQILVDHARRKGAAKRGGDVTIVGLEEAGEVARADIDILALEEALEELGTFDARQRNLVELKFFGGLTIAEAAAALGVSPATVEREWATAKAWLFDRLSTGPV